MRGCHRRSSGTVVDDTVVDRKLAWCTVVCLQALVPIARIINVPIDAHRFLIGRGGETIRKIMQDNDVHIAVPKNEESDEVRYPFTFETFLMSSMEHMGTSACR